MVATVNNPDTRFKAQGRRIDKADQHVENLESSLGALNHALATIRLDLAQVRRDLSHVRDRADRIDQLLRAST